VPRRRVLLGYVPRSMKCALTLTNMTSNGSCIAQRLLDVPCDGLEPVKVDFTTHTLRRSRFLPAAVEQFAQ